MRSAFVLVSKKSLPGVPAVAQWVKNPTALGLLHKGGFDPWPVQWVRVSGIAVPVV